MRQGEKTKERKPLGRENGKSIMQYDRKVCMRFSLDPDGADMRADGGGRSLRAEN